MPSKKEFEPGLFVPQSIFASSGQTVLMGILQKGELKLNTVTSFKGETYKLIDIQALNRHVKTITAEDTGSQGLGVVLANLPVEVGQDMTNQELLFK